VFIENHRYPVLNFGLGHSDARLTFPFSIFQNFKIQNRAVDSAVRAFNKRAVVSKRCRAAPASARRNRAKADKAANLSLNPISPAANPCCNRL
jgi:hypothetical protein